MNSRRAAAPPSPSPTPRGRLGAALVAILLAGQALLLGSLILGEDTLYLRDVLRTHGAFEAARVQEWDAGRPAIVDPYRAGGQPRWGNPNSLPFYPTGLLQAIAPGLWSLNAHFWIHLLLAPWALAWLGRELGLGPAPALVAGILYAFSGFVLSHLAFANLVAGAALAPALAAALLVVMRRPTPVPLLALGGTWALLLVGGDPLYGVLALGLALVAWLGGGRRAWRGPGLGAGIFALGAGTLAALPQIVELARILPTSLRGVRGYDLATRTLASWDPRQAVEWLLPLVFGRVDRLGDHRFWGHHLHPGGLPLFLTLAPGVLALALAAGAGIRSRVARTGWLLVGIGLFLALGRFNPALAPLLALPGLEALRFPVKAWLLVAPGLALLAARGWERISEERSRRRILGTLLGLGIAVGLLLAPQAIGLAAPGPGSWIPDELGSRFREAEERRWLATGGLSLLVLGLGAASLAAGPRARGGALLLIGLHVGSQVLFLAPVTARERIDAIESAPRLTDEDHPGPFVHGRIDALFGPPRIPPGPSDDARLLVRQGAFSSLPFVGIRRGLRYELDPAPEGLDAFVTFLARDAVRAVEDRERLRLLSRWGVRRAILDRPLSPEDPGARLVRRGGAYGSEFFLYALPDAVEPARLVSGARWAPTPARALGILLDPAFEPSREVVLAGEGASLAPGRGRVEVVEDTPLSLEVVTSSNRPGHLVVERTFQPLYRATVDGAGVGTRIADLHRIAIPVPAGVHRVRLRVDRSPGRRALAGAVAGLLLLAWVALRSRARVVTSGGP